MKLNFNVSGTVDNSTNDKPLYVIGQDETGRRTIGTIAAGDAAGTWSATLTGNIGECKVWFNPQPA